MFHWDQINPCKGGIKQIHVQKGPFHLVFHVTKLIKHLLCVRHCTVLETWWWVKKTWFLSSSARKETKCCVRAQRRPSDGVWGRTFQQKAEGGEVADCAENWKGSKPSTQKQGLWGRCNQKPAYAVNTSCTLEVAVSIPSQGEASPALLSFLFLFAPSVRTLVSSSEFVYNSLVESLFASWLPVSFTGILSYIILSL